LPSVTGPQKRTRRSQGLHIAPSSMVLGCLPERELRPWFLAARSAKRALWRRLQPPNRTQRHVSTDRPTPAAYTPTLQLPAVPMRGRVWCRSHTEAASQPRRAAPLGPGSEEHGRNGPRPKVGTMAKG